MMEMIDQSGQAPMNFPAVDQDTFERVWRRVMPDQPLAGSQGAASPPPQQGQMPMTQGQTPMMWGQPPMMQEQMPMMREQTPMMQQQTPMMRDDVMMPWGGSPAWQERLDLSRMPQTAPGPVRRGPEVDILSCLEQETRGLVPLLETLMDHAAAAERDYLALSRQAAGQTSRMIARHASQHRRQLRRLSAAHFLITGERYRPRREAVWSPSGSIPLALRELFMREHRWAAELRRGVENSGDPCLRALFAELSGEDEALADDIRAVLEEF